MKKEPLKTNYRSVLYACRFTAFRPPALGLLSFLLTVLLALAGCSEKDNTSGMTAILDKYVEFWNTGDFQHIEKVLCEDFELLMTPNFEAERGIEKFTETVLKYRKAYPDFKLVVNDLVIDEDKAAAIWTITATNTGAGSSQLTGKSIDVTGISFIHFRDGKIRDEWIASNNLFWLMQLGYTLSPP
jgi:steroid delta-isomerase-like uncharacterized protein